MSYCVSFCLYIHTCRHICWLYIPTAHTAPFEKAEWSWALYIHVDHFQACKCTCLIVLKVGIGIILYTPVCLCYIIHMYIQYTCNRLLVWSELKVGRERGPLCKAQLLL